MTVPAYHVGQILYHRASGERAIVTEVMPGIIALSANIANMCVEVRKGDMPGIFSTEPVVVPSGFYPIEKPTEPGWYWWKASLQFGGSPRISEVRMLDGKLMLPADPAITTYYGPKIPSP